MSFRTGVHQADALLGQVGLPLPFDVREFCRRVGELRGRPLLLVPQPAGSMTEAVGLLVGLRQRDEIHYVADTSTYHQQVIILHEVGHLVSEHGGVHTPLPLQLLGDDWDPRVLERLRARRRYDDDDEREAEGFATAVLDRVAEHTGHAAATSSPPAQARLTSMFLP